MTRLCRSITAARAAVPGKRLHRELGVTLIEMVITIAVLGIIAGFIGRPLINLLENRQRLNRQSDQAESIDYALSRMTNDVRFEKGAVQCNAGTLSVGAPPVVYQYDAGQNTLYLERINPPERFELVANVNSFTCTNVEAGVSLYELAISTDTGDIAVRAFRR